MNEHDVVSAAPSSFDEFQAEVLHRHEGLSRQLQKIARYSLDNPDDVALTTVTALAEKADVQPSAIVRFAKSFGFEGFSAWQHLFKQHLITNQDSYRERIKSLKGDASEAPSHLLTRFVEAAIVSLEQLNHSASPQLIERAIELLAGARDIHLLGQRRSFAVVQYLHYALSRLECRCLLADGAGGMLGHQVARAGTEDVVIAVSFAPYTESVLELAAELAKRGVKIVAITDSPLSPLSRVSNVCFEIAEGDIAFRSLVAPMCLAQSLVVGLGQALAGDQTNTKTTEAGETL